MITTALFLFFLEIVNWMLGFLPLATLPSGVISVLAVMHHGVALLWLVCPMSTFLTVFYIALATETAIQGFNLAVFIYNKLRGSG
jgi:hypothetical protein